jgi:hypothetical protein
MVPPAKDAHIDFVRLAAEEPSSMYFEAFLRDGYEAWPRRYQQRFSGLATWSGVGGLKQSLRRIAGISTDWRVLLASRSLPLLKLGAGCQFRVCRNVLTTDLSWPTYQQAVIDRAHRTRNQVTVVAVRDRVFNDGWTTRDVADHLAVEYERCKCDGLFLPAVDHMGIRTPVEAIVDKIKGSSELRFLLIDGAQAFCHVPLDDCIAHADFIVAGSHKWMGAYLPLGIAFFGQPRSQEFIDTRLWRYRQAAADIDPVLQFSEQINRDELDGRSETANLTGLFSCDGACRYHSETMQEAFEADLDVAARVRNVPRPSGSWSELPIASELRSRIRLFRECNCVVRDTTATAIRSKWFDAGCVVSGLDYGFARLAFPYRSFRP